MEATYLKENLGCLTECLKEVAERRPHDPIEYIAFWLRKHIGNESYLTRKGEEAKRLQEEQANEAVEQEKRARRLEEARRLSEEEQERKKAEEERKAKEAASASKLPVVEEKEEPELEGTAQDVDPEAQASVDVTPQEDSAETKEGDEQETTDADITEQDGEKTEQEEGGDGGTTDEPSGEVQEDQPEES